MVIPGIISNPNTPLWAKFVVVLTSLLKIYPALAFVLLISLTWMVAELLKIFVNRISECYHETKSVRKNSNAAENVLDEWKRHYLLIDRLIEELNRSFGFIILILVSSTFVKIINSLFKLMSNFNDGGGWVIIQLFFLLLDCISLTLMAYTSHRVSREVKDFT